jgi:hypothetical protein
VNGTPDLLLRASRFIGASVKTKPGADGDPEPAGECDHAAHDLACELAVAAYQLGKTDPKMATALADVLASSETLIDLGKSIQRTDDMTAAFAADAIGLTEEQLDAAQARAIDALLEESWTRMDDIEGWLQRGDLDQDGEAIHENTVRLIAAAALEQT